ncbi:TonB-dependent receptor plug domain-containing protein [Parachryseolinea silvisoli]|uniref:TonB-dependent receptor plug domain-containing protein n=1 Tax=Parachryseolinea silvisoli TaxID=2873601 RepID=UPI00295F4D91|nr:TonB-dependent receptor plug domain-containing protein [Parachryseolinea silvisoli]MCD9017278.1 TonB-dependent receptor plug domain-containing protein [Parachryseolinea silvisoli]
MMKKYTCALLFLLSACWAGAQDLDSLLNLNAFTEESDLQKILNKNVAVSVQKLSARETPGIISLVTAEEIQNSGARDLTDVLRMIPGFDVLQDLQFVMGIGLRGSWANEGKVLVMVDGQPFNDLLYQGVALGNRFPVDAIERIEIIRGPGSAIYGGSAEYGVINILTKAANSLDGVAVYGTGGFHADAVGRTNGGVMAASKSENFAWDLSAFAGQGIVSDATQYADAIQQYEASDLASSTKADPLNLNLGLRYKKLAFRTMYDQFETSDPMVDVSFKNFFADLRYEWALTNKLTLTPQVKYYNQVPWTYGSKGEAPDFEARATRLLTEVDAAYELSRKASVNFGALYFHDNGDYKAILNGFTGSRDLSLDNVAFYAQGLFKHRLANATVGFRYEKNNRYGAAFVPRLALTKKIENLHFKVLYSQAFRAPSLQNINIARTGKIKPEKSDVFELELGYQFTPEMLLALNAFSITTRRVMIYGSEGADDTFQEWYENATKSGSQGLELVYSIRRKMWYASLTYSYSQAISGNTVDVYEVPQTDKQYAGFPAHKVTLSTNISVTSHVTINPTFIYAGRRYAYTTLDEDENPASTELDPYLLANVFLNYRDLLPGLTAGIGAYDVFNERPAIAQAYNGGYAPIPGRSREYIVKLAYQINFKK